MKMMKLTCSLAFVLAVALAATGCRNHKPVGVTPLPGQTSSGLGGEPGAGGTIGAGGGANANEAGGGPTANISPGDYNEDRAALASHTVYFAFDSAVVKTSERENLQAVAAALSADSSAKLLIEGHCDERGTEEYNRALGERRALALRQALAKIGVDPSRIRTISYGKDKPAVDGHDESAWAKNRRGEFVLLHPKSGA